MPRKLMWVVLLSAAIAVTVLFTETALATPASGFTGTTLALGQFDEIDVLNYFIRPSNLTVPNARMYLKPHMIGNPGWDSLDFWFSLQKTKGSSDLYVQSNVWQPGGTTGWHSHPGHSLIIVTAGTVTNYESDDPDCNPNVYTQGMGFVDAGGDHVHNIRNEGDVPASTIAVQLIPAGADRRIDAEQPANCPSF